MKSASKPPAQTRHFECLVTAYGYHQPSGIWFSKNCAFTPDGKVLRADPLAGVFMLSRKRHPDEFFAPEVPTRVLPAPSFDLELNRPGRTRNMAFRRFAKRLRFLVGGFDAFIAMGMAFAHFARPEIMGRHSRFPTLRIYGGPGAGKTSLAKILMRIHGVKMPAVLQPATPPNFGDTGVYSSIPVPVEEVDLGAGNFPRAKVKAMFSSPGRNRLEVAPARWASLIVLANTNSLNVWNDDRMVQIGLGNDGRSDTGRAHYYRMIDRDGLDLERLGAFVLQKRIAYSSMVLDAIDRTWEDPRFARVHPSRLFNYSMAAAGFSAAIRLFSATNDSAMRAHVSEFNQRFETAMRGE